MNGKLSAPNPSISELFCDPPIERGTKLRETQSTQLPLLITVTLAFAAVSCPPLAPHLVQFLFSILFPIFL
jgi:hypothetical protein